MVKHSGFSGEMMLNIEIKRDDSIPAWGAYLRCEAQHEGSHVILANVQAIMAPSLKQEDGLEVPMSRDDRKRLLIITLMHEFGHALEKHMGLEVEEEAIEQACEEWERAYLEAS